MMTRCVYDDVARCAMLTLRGAQEEEGEEWEYVSDRHGSHGGREEAHAEPGLVVEPLRGVSENKGRLNELARQCQTDPHRTSRIESCVQYVSLLGKALGVIKKGWRALKSAAHAAWRFVGEQTVSWSEFEARVKAIFGTGKEIFSLAKCTYELFYAKGPCGSP